jgi:hypothetical protein
MIHAYYTVPFKILISIHWFEPRHDHTWRQRDFVYYYHHIEKGFIVGRGIETIKFYLRHRKRPQPCPQLQYVIMWYFIFLWSVKIKPKANTEFYQLSSILNIILLSLANVASHFQVPSFNAVSNHQCMTYINIIALFRNFSIVREICRLQKTRRPDMKSQPNNNNNNNYNNNNRIVNY